MKIFIDTNVYLNFYRLRGEKSLVALERLLKALKESKIELILPRQTENEFYQNKNRVAYQFIASQRKRLNAYGGIEVPAPLEGTDEGKKIKKAHKDLMKRYKKFLEKYQKKVTSPRSTINRLIKEIFSLSTVTEDDEKILKRAEKRYLRGQPPRKSDFSFGDAIIWELLLDKFVDEDLYIITNDNDYLDPLIPGNANEFMGREWKKKSRYDLMTYKTLGEFADEHLKGRGGKGIDANILEEERKSSEAWAMGGISASNSLMSSMASTIAGTGPTTIWDSVPGIPSCTNCDRLISPGTVLGGLCVSCHLTNPLQVSSVGGFKDCSKCHSAYVATYDDKGLCPQCSP